jgi:hypothetical protein
MKHPKEMKDQNRLGSQQGGYKVQGAHRHQIGVTHKAPKNKVRFSSQVAIHESNQNLSRINPDLWPESRTETPPVTIIGL